MMLDELINDLLAERDAIGNVPVLLNIGGRIGLTRIDNVQQHRVGKADPLRCVSRGGVPVVVISE